MSKLTCSVSTCRRGTFLSAELLIAAGWKKLVTGEWLCPDCNGTPVVGCAGCIGDPSKRAHKCEA